MGLRDVLQSLSGSPVLHSTKDEGTEITSTKQDGTLGSPGSRTNSTEAELLAAISVICRDIPITTTEILLTLSPEDIDDWFKGNICDETLRNHALALVQRRNMDLGKRPDHYVERAVCKQCGPIWLWFSGEVEGCPWCWNRLAGRPIPRP